MHKSTTYQAYGVRFAKDNYGNTIWARSRDELMRLMRLTRLFGGSPC